MNTMRTRVVAVVCAVWLLVGVVLGAQSVMASALGVPGAQAMPLGAVVRATLVQTLPWIPVSLAVVALTVRFPLRHARRPRHLAIHLAAAVALAFLANVLVVLGYWAMAGRFQGVEALGRAAARWAALRLHLAALVYAAILAITEAVRYYREARARELQLARVEGQLARAQVQALNAQIRPHFLFNTLHTIGQLWRSGRSDDADAVLDHLGALFHKVQRSTSRVEIPLADELEMVREYLAIEQARFPDRLRTTVQAPPDALDCSVPPLILQPIVENAVRHGISAVSSAGAVDVTAACDNGRLRLTVRDDGPGMNGGRGRPGSGTGIRNTRERLTQLYGDGASFRIAESSGGGMLVTIELPACRQATADG